MASAQTITSSALGVHNLGGTGCVFCHAMHNGVTNAGTLWAQKLSTVQNYTLYSSATMVNQVQQPVLGQGSNLCLSCHDGTVAVGQSVPAGTIQGAPQVSGADLLGTNLSTVHPFNFKLPLQPAASLLPSVTATPPSTGSLAVRMYGGNVQCETCHTPHVQNLDVSGAFLVMDNSESAICLACHVSTPTSPVLTATHTHRESASATIASSQTRPSSNVSYNALTAWRNSAHEQANNQVSKGANAGPHGTPRRNGCASCHISHKAQAGGALLAPAAQVEPNIDPTAQTCLNCHNGGTNVTPAIPDIYQEFTKKGHPFPPTSGTANTHVLNEPTILDKNRHATCVDCHEPHASTKTLAFTSTTLRSSQNGVTGVSAADGTTVVTPAVNQYEICFRCHGTSIGKQTLAQYGYLPTRLVNAADPLNLIPQLAQTAGSSHPVTHDRSSSLPQPSLLQYMWNLDGRTQGRVMGTRLLCTDCHNADDNREFGGSGPNGPHGSQYDHILERRYEFSEVASGSGPGTTIQNLLPVVVDPGANGPYSLCAKCHNLTNIMSNASFTQHSLHINAGFSCSVCHAAHGVPLGSSASSGVRLVNFDVAVVAPNDVTNAPIAYNRGANTCTLKCHNYNHYQNGTVTLSQGNTVRTTRQ